MSLAELYGSGKPLPEVIDEGRLYHLYGCRGKTVRDLRIYLRLRRSNRVSNRLTPTALVSIPVLVEADHRSHSYSNRSERNRKALGGLFWLELLHIPPLLSVIQVGITFIRPSIGRERNSPPHQDAKIGSLRLRKLLTYLGVERPASSAWARWVPSNLPNSLLAGPLGGDTDLRSFVVRHCTSLRSWLDSE